MATGLKQSFFLLAPEKFSVALLSAEVAELLHADKYLDAGQRAARWLGQTSGVVVEVETHEKATEILTLLLHWLLDNDGYEEAANILWGKTLFTPEPESARRVWRAFEESNWILLMGAASMSKSYSMGVRLMLEWIRDPEYTNVKVLGPSEQHLEDNLFSHLVTLHRQSTIKLPGEVGKLFIGLDTRARKGSISGVVIPLGKKAAGRLQGAKRVNRKVPHPKFGKLSRQYIFLDEIANIPPGVWSDIDNLIAASQGDDGQKIVGAFNPKNIHDETGLRTEPLNGWENFDADTDLDWTSKRGWRVVRLDAARSENILAGKIIYSGLQTKEGFAAQVTNAGGLDSAGYWSMCRGCFPPAGALLSIIPAGMLVKIKAEVLWYDTPTPLAGVDLALLGGDTAIFAKGLFGMASGVRYPGSLEHPNGETVMFKDTKGRTLPRNVLQLESLIEIPKGESVSVKNEIMRLCRSFSIRPDWLCVDKTGNGVGVFDMLKFEYGDGVIGVNFYEGASESKILVEDHANADELYERRQGELWFATRKFIEFNYCKLASACETDKLFPQLTQRRYKHGKRVKVESKEEYQSRSNGKSPDEADAFTLLVHCARKASGFVPGMLSENSSDHRVDNDEDDEGPRIDITNRTASLDD